MKESFPHSLSLLFLAALALSACAETWQKPGATEQDFEAMDTTCMNRAGESFPPKLRREFARPGYMVPFETQCNGAMNAVSCFSTGGYYVPPQLITIDDNEEARQNIYRACLIENGWRPVE